MAFGHALFAANDRLTIGMGSRKMKYYVVEAFAENVFQGNQAGVCLVDRMIDEGTMQNIAAENNLAETAFVVRNGGDFDLRWFTPEVEIDLCGHATLASAFVINNYVDPTIEAVRFNTLSGMLTVVKKGDLYEMDFPSRKPEEISVTPLMAEALGAPVLEAHISRDMLLVLESEEAVRSLRPDFALAAQISGCFAVIASARGEEADFVSRFFAPNAGIPEDPVTGSSHSTLIPFWSERLKKKKMVARQLSKRGGTL